MSAGGKHPCGSGSTVPVLIEHQWSNRRSSPTRFLRALRSGLSLPLNLEVFSFDSRRRFQPKPSPPMAQGGTGVRSDMEFSKDVRRTCCGDTSPGWSMYRPANAIETPCQSDALAGAASVTLRGAWLSRLAGFVSRSQESVNWAESRAASYSGRHDLSEFRHFSSARGWTTLSTLRAAPSCRGVCLVGSPLRGAPSNW